MDTCYRPYEGIFLYCNPFLVENLIKKPATRPNKAKKSILKINDIDQNQGKCLDFDTIFSFLRRIFSQFALLILNFHEKETIESVSYFIPRKPLTTFRVNL